MQTFSMVAQKGGTGKTSLLLNLAAAAHEPGHKTLIIAVDSQASACKWADRRAKAHPDKAGYPLVMDAQPERLSNAVEKATMLGIDFILIDTPAKSGDAGLAAARVADVVINLLPSPDARHRDNPKYERYPGKRPVNPSGHQSRIAR